MTQKHNYTIGIDDYGDVYDIVIRDNDTIIAVLSSGKGPAQHLVKTGNCFDELLEAAKVALRTLLTGDSKLLPINLLEEAIAKAEGRRG